MSAIEIRNYEGDGADLADLIRRTWQTNLAGKIWFPLWDQAYLDWRLLDERIGNRDFLSTAYQGTKPVGCLLAEATEFQIGDRRVKGTYSSFLSVDPEVKAPGLAIRLVEALRKRHLEHEMAISMGVTSSYPDMPNRRFWDSLAKRKPQDFRFFQPIQFWGRVFDGPVMREAALNRLERFAGRALPLIPWGGPGKEDAAGVRPYRREDLSRCLAWLNVQGEKSDIRMLWTERRLDVQLGHATYPRTLVVEDTDGRGAFLNYYSIEWSGARVVRVGLIDLFAGDASLGRQVDLLKAAGRRMKDEGLHVAMMMVSDASPTKALLAGGFAPGPSGNDLFSVFPDASLKLESAPSVHVLFT